MWTGKGCACSKGSIFKPEPMPSFPAHPSYSDSILHGQIWLLVPPRTFLLGPVADRHMQKARRMQVCRG